MSSSVFSTHIFLGLSLILLPVGFHSKTLLGILFPSIRITCPNQANLLLFITHQIMHFYIQVSHELRSLLRESVPYVKIYRYNPKHLCPKLNGYGDNGHRKVWASGVSTYCMPSVTPYSYTAHARQRDVTS